MIIITEQDRDFLLQKNPTQTFVSILTPTQRSGKGGYYEEDKLRFKNNLKEAETKLLKRGLEEKKVEKFLSPASDLLEENEFWQHQSDGLAVYFNEEKFIYHTLPTSFYNLTYINDHFYIKPISSFFNNENRFFILVLSQNAIRFFEANSYSITSIKIDDLVPESLEETERQVEKTESLQHHSAGNRNTIYHGHGGEKNYQSIAVEKFLREIDQGLMKMLHDEKAPLILAGVDELISMYKSINSYPHIVDEHVSGNFDNEHEVLIQEKGWNKVKNFFQQGRLEKAEKFLFYKSKGKAHTNIEEIIPLARQGRIDSLFTSSTQNIWGNFDENTLDVKIHKEKQTNSACLLNLSVFYTMFYKGKVYNLPPKELPTEDMIIGAVKRI